MGNKKYWSWLIVLIILGLAVTAYLLSTGSPNGQSADDQLIGGNQDEHGCLIAAGYSWCEASQKCLRVWEEDCQDDVANILIDVAAVTGANFTEPESSLISWRSEEIAKDSEAEILTALAVTAEVLTVSQLQLAKSYFLDHGFVINEINAGDGPMGSLESYNKDDNKIVCQLTYQPDLYDPLSQTEKVTAGQPKTVSVVVIYCGRLSETKQE